MRFLLLLAATIALALGLGGWSAERALEAAADLGTETVGPWSANPTAGSVDADPYSKARLARIGNLTLGIGEGIQFRASRDSTGQPLRLDCSYRLSGQTPPARVWTLAAFGLDGRVVQPGAGRPGWLVSRNIIRAEDNSFTATVGPRAAPGNWLSVQGSGSFVLTLTLYDTPASSSSGLGDLEMPNLVREACDLG
ncbi:MULTISPECIES: DUF1214 domain-containing protein [unclassified Aureimonas]|uniref:DUF1214 domain-containing protein n=1 Tax=unclassified Aureimonas TaxID=2615206 RepID=UPI0006FDFC62|nr:MULTISPECIES: DUF1214 domain-containing protein [unclassified Aureimonas]KQT55261.1 hypothetical protein ASG62_10525 [Aureimonas sp. Leaf427]KQT71052.1 hypothetical protein ASG54_20910 [Aureimonas sp. Leaf460]